MSEENQSRVALYPGSFDPITLGHLDMIRRGARLFDKLYVGVLVNLDKKSLFSDEERVIMIRRVTADIPNVEVISFSGLLVDCCERLKAYTLLRGLRGVNDFEYELQLAQGYRAINPKIDTVYLISDPANSFISSSMVRQLAAYGGRIEEFLAPETVPMVREKFAQSVHREQ